MDMHDVVDLLYEMEFCLHKSFSSRLKLGDEEVPFRAASLANIETSVITLLRYPGITAGLVVVVYDNEKNMFILRIISS